MECKEKADQEQALAWLMENSNPDARPGRKRHKNCLLGKKKKRKSQNPKNHSLKSGATTQKRRETTAMLTQVASLA